MRQFKGSQNKGDFTCLDLNVGNRRRVKRRFEGHRAKRKLVELVPLRLGCCVNEGSTGQYDEHECKLVETTVSAEFIERLPSLLDKAVTRE